MVDTESLLFHEESFCEFFRCWQDTDYRNAAGISVGFAAYHALAHAGSVLRMRATEELPPELAALSTEERTSLVSTACDFVHGFSLPLPIMQILSREAAEPDDIEEFEHTLLQRDELDVVIELGKHLVGDAVQRDGVLLRKLSEAVSVAARLDDILLARPDLMAVCSRVLVGIRPVEWLANGSYPDWFALARTWDEELSSPELDDLVPVPARSSVGFSRARSSARPAVRYARDVEFATAAVDRRPASGGEPMAGPTPSEVQTIDYLTHHLEEILQHGNSDVWFCKSPSGALDAHTYEEDRADGFTAKSGPHCIPCFPDPPALAEPDVTRLLDWLVTDVALARAAAEEVCRIKGWRR